MLDVMREEGEEDERNALIGAQKWGGVSSQKWGRGKRSWWKRRRELLLTMNEAPKIVRADCDLCQAANVCMPPEMWRCGCVREKLEESFIYTVLTVDARRGNESDRIVAKTTEIRRTTSTLYTQRNSKSPANKAEKSGLVSVLDADADKSSRVKQAPSMPVEEEGDVNATIPSSPPGASLIQVIGTATLTRLIEYNKKGWGAVGSRQTYLIKGSKLETPI